MICSAALHSNPNYIFFLYSFLPSPISNIEFSILAKGWHYLYEIWKIDVFEKLLKIWETTKTEGYPQNYFKGGICKETFASFQFRCTEDVSANHELIKCLLDDSLARYLMRRVFYMLTEPNDWNYVFIILNDTLFAHKANSPQFAAPNIWAISIYPGFGLPVLFSQTPWKKNKGNYVK